MTCHIQTQYNAFCRTTFACDLESLARLLKRAAEAVQTNRDLPNQYKSIANGKVGTNRGGKGSRIPKNTCFEDKGDKGPGEVPRSDSNKKKKCEHCAQWKPHVKNIHWTKDCEIFEADGTHKFRGGGGKLWGARSQKRYITTLLIR